MYEKSKDKIREEPMYDNTKPVTVILCRTRTNALPLNDRKRDTNGSTVCDICGAEEETLSHFVLCSALSETRREITTLQKPYIEDEVRILSRFSLMKTA